MNALDVLELELGCTLEDAKRNFRRLSVIYHTDKKTGDSEKFHEICNAYQYLKKNPDALSGDTPKAEEATTYSYINLPVTIEDAYLGKVKRLSIKQGVRCAACNGTGSTEFEKGVCIGCDGTGVSNSRILSLMNEQKSLSCPLCNGTGVKKDTECKKCKGKKAVTTAVTHTIKLRPEHLLKRYLILPGKGSFSKQNRKNSDIYFRLIFKKDPIYSLEKGTLCRKVKISLAQKTIRDRGIINVFGKSYSYKVPESGELFTLYHKEIPSGIGNQILLRFEIVPKEITEEIHRLYRKIIEEEKKQT